MPMVTFKHRGNFDRTYAFLVRARKLKLDSIIKQYAEEGVTALRTATPKDTGISAESWKYEIVHKRSGFSIYWTNDHVTDTGVPVVILLQYGHGTGTGGYVEGQDFINPAIRPIFDKISQNLWKEVSSL